MTARYLHHLTINTGHLVRSARCDVGDDVVTAVRERLEFALTTGGSIIDFPAPDPTGLSVVADGRGLIATLWTPMTSRDAIVADAAQSPWRPLVTLGVAPTSKVAARLWPMIEAACDRPACGLQRPQAPWATAVLHVADTAIWIGDAERVIAWAWIDGKPSGANL